MSFRFEKVMQAIIKRLDQILLEDQEDDRGVITSKDFMNEFATEEFLNKNIRVESTTVHQRGEDETKTNDGNVGGTVSRHDAFGLNMDEDEIYRVDIRQEREAIKKRFDHYKEQRRLEEERARRRRL